MNETNTDPSPGSSGQAQPGTSGGKPGTSRKHNLSVSLSTSLTMVAGAGGSNFHSEFRNDPVVKEMRQIREENARRQKHDYSHVFRNKSRFDFVRISAVIMGMEFVYSAETAFVSPILLSIGIEHQLMTMVWGISPLIGFFLSPVIGSVSDRCRSRFGRRRPVLLALGIGLITGCILVPYGRNIGAWFGDLGEIVDDPANTINGAAALIDLNGTVVSDAFRSYNFYRVDEQIAEHRTDYRWAIVITIIGTILTDFNADNCMTPSRAYLLDVSLPEDHGRACSTFSILAGLGGSIGYAMGGINWDETSFGEFLGGSIKTVFTLVVIIFTICLTISLTSFREIPLPLLESDELLRPLTETVIKKEKARRQNQIFVVKDVSKALTAQLQAIQSPEDAVPQKINNALVDVERAPHGKDEPELEDDDENAAMGPMDFIKSIVMMPKSIAILCLTNLFCWMSHLSYALYFTDFVGEEVFKGNPAAPSYSDEYKLFLEGVRYACFGMAIYSISCSTCSFTIEKLIKVLRARTVYCGGLILDAIGMACMAFFPNKVTVYVLSATGGIVYALLFTMPFLLLGQYHAKGTFKVTKPGAEVTQERKRGLATDIAVVGGMIFVAQIIVALGMGSLISAFGTTSVVVFSASICSLLASGIYNWLASVAISGTQTLTASRPVVRALQCRRRYRSCSEVENATMVKTGGSSAASGRVVLARRKSLVQKDPVVEELRRAREENARQQQYDYSHVFRKKSLLDFVRLSFVIMGIEIVYSAETAFVTPILLGIGIEHQLMTIVWGISPLIGFIVSPFLGTFSDRCRSRLGRRRPLLLGLGLGLVLGCLLLPFGETIGHWLGDVGETINPVINNTVTIDGNFNPYEASAATTDHFRWAIVVTILGTILLDFCADSSQAPSMAFLLDVSLPEDHGQACSTYSLLSGVGGCIGYLIGAIDWDGTMLGELLGGNINTVFILVTVIFALCLSVTVCSFREIPLPLMERNELLQPLTERIITRERQRYTAEKGLHPMKDIAGALLLQLENENEPSEENHAMAVGYSEKEPLLSGFLEEKPTIQRSAKEFLKTTFRIPSTLGILCVTNLFCWMSHISYSLYFTDFVGENVFGGDPMAHSDSDEYALYIEGVRYGCFGMAIYSIACSTYSCTIERLIRLFRARNVYSGGLLIDFLGMLCMAMFPNKVTVYVFSVTGGIVGALLFTMPYIILAKYHAKGLVRFYVN
uniref:Major facilitator superfamily (MFS) profile domain-containing protein n=1 Tax=Anopheles christyi TaxID=43041 RepID=A0A182K6G2_9DIPT